MQSFGQEMSSSKQFQSTHSRFSSNGDISRQTVVNTNTQQGFSFRHNPPPPQPPTNQLPRPSTQPITMQDMRNQLLNAQSPSLKKTKANVNPMELGANDPRLNLKPVTATKSKKK
jgi:hypothetical protein